MYTLLYIQRAIRAPSVKPLYMGAPARVPYPPKWGPEPLEHVPINIKWIPEIGFACLVVPGFPLLSGFVRLIQTFSRLWRVNVSSWVLGVSGVVFACY